MKCASTVSIVRMAAGVAAFGVLAPRARAQLSRAVDSDSGAPTRAGLTVARGDGPSDAAAVAAAVVARGRPRSFQVVAVSVPPELAAMRGVSFDVRATGVAPILGTTSGTVATGSSMTPAPVLVTVGVPPHAIAGRRVVAFVRFAAPGASPIDVPVDLDVVAVRDVSITAVQDLHATRAGRTLEVRYRVINAGNAADTVTLDIEPPPGWALKGTPRRRLALPLNATVDQMVALRVPTSAAGSGTSFLRLSLLARDGIRGRTETAIEVLPGTGASSRRGAVVTTDVATVAGSNVSANTLYSASLSGPVTEHVQVSGQVTSQAPLGGDAARALARVGSYTTAPYLTVFAPTWRLSLGTTGESFSDVTGLNAWGRGAAAAYTGADWTATALGARPTSGSGQGTTAGGLFGARVGHRVGEGWANVTATHLVDEGPLSRHLDALGVGGSVPLPALATLSAEVAERQFNGGSGFGWTSELRHDGEDGNLALRATHAPGGSAAFARGTDELSGSMARTLSRRLLVSGSAFRLEDSGGTFSSVNSHGWSVDPQLRLSSTTDAIVEARSSSFEAAGSAGDFGSDETALGVTLNTIRGSLYGSGSVLGSQLTRSTTTPSGTRVVEQAPHSQVRGTAGLSTLHGTFELSASLEQTGTGVGLLPRQDIVGFRVDRVPVGRIAVPVYVSAGVQRYGWFGDRVPLNIVRAGMTALLPGDFSFTVDGEHNPLLAATSGGRGWVVAMKLEHATRLPRLGDHRTSGVVYQDLNGNGRRDANEPGFAGVLVRRGATAIVTDQDGRFEFTDNVPGAPHLDVRSLPFGWVSSGPNVESHGRTTVGVMPTSLVDVQLVVTSPDSSVVPSVDLSNAQVVARDSLGRSWISRVTPSGAASFDALPLGTYVIDLDVSQVTEPLQVKGGPVSFTVVGRGRRELRIPVYTRPVRFNVLPHRATDSATTPRRQRPAPRPPAVDTIPGNIDEPSVSSKAADALVALVQEGATHLYTVRQNDTLRRLATRFLDGEMRWPLLYDLNRDQVHDPDLLLIGQRLHVVTLSDGLTGADTDYLSSLVSLPRRPEPRGRR